MNTPYVKKFDKNGVCTNPTKPGSILIHTEPNRQARRQNPPRFMNNRAGHAMFAASGAMGRPAFKYVRSRQVIALKHKKGKLKGMPTGEIKIIEHYN